MAHLLGISCNDNLIQQSVRTPGILKLSWPQAREVDLDLIYI